MARRGILVCYLLICLFSIRGLEGACDTSTQTSERLSQAVVIELYRTQVEEWNSNDNTVKVSNRITEAANSYCASNPSSCGLDNCCSSSLFKQTDAGVEAGYPENEDKDMLLKVYLNLPAASANSSTLQCVVSQSTLQKIIEDARQSIYDDTGVWITYIDSLFYGIPPDTLLNTIIIPIACVVLLAVILLAVILHLWNKRREAIANRQKKIEERKRTKSSKLMPSYTVSKETLESGSRMKPPPTSDSREQLYPASKSGIKKHLAQTASVHSEDSAIRVDSEVSRGHFNSGYSADNTGGTMEMKQRGTSLQPLQVSTHVDGASGGEKKKRKKSKKHKKSKDTDSFLTGNGNLTTEYYIDLTNGKSGYIQD